MSSSFRRSIIDAVARRNVPAQRRVRIPNGRCPRKTFRRLRDAAARNAGEGGLANGADYRLASIRQFRP
jgi:hypothetical protein